LILPTCLQGYVPALHRALLKIVFALRQLDGLVFSQHEAEDMGIRPGSHAVQKRNIIHIHKDMVRGLVMLEGCLPAMHLNPLLHRFVHYGLQTAKVGALRWFSMFVFERYNKKIKGLVKNAKTPMSSIASNITIEVANRFMTLAEDSEEIKRNPCCCMVSGRGRIYA